MKINWKIIIITCVVCILPVFPGMVLWDELPDKIAIHFNVYNQPDNYAPKGFVVFGLPLLMAFLQGVCCVISDLSRNSRRGNPEKVVKWTLPVIIVILQSVTLGYSLGLSLDMRIIAGFITGVLLIITGFCITKFDYVKNYDISKDKAKQINRFTGYTTVIMGVLMLSSLFLPPVATVIWIFLMIPYAAIIFIYSIKVKRK